jgi:hypothetical protein
MIYDTVGNKTVPHGFSSVLTLIFFMGEKTALPKKIAMYEVNVIIYMPRRPPVGEKKNT